MIRAAPSEHQIQASLIKLLGWACAENVEFYKISNEGKRGFRAAAMAKAEGLKAGVADLGFVLPPHGRAAFLELKKRGGRLSVPQMGFGARVQRSGALWAVAYSYEEAVDVMRAWNVIEPGALIL